MRLENGQLSPITKSIIKDIDDCRNLDIDERHEQTVAILLATLHAMGEKEIVNKFNIINGLR